MPTKAELREIKRLQLLDARWERPGRCLGTPGRGHLPMAGILLLLLGFLPADRVLRDHTTLVEVNRYYEPEECGDRLVLEQLVWWDWYPGPVWDYRVVDWKIVPGLRPRYDYRRRLWVVAWQDGRQLREVTSDFFRETETYHDVEITDRAILPPEQRRGLRR